LEDQRKRVAALEAGLQYRISKPNLPPMTPPSKSSGQTFRCSGPRLWAYICGAREMSTASSWRPI
jgi:hypothetical protein